jgi:hypothetical protein
VRFPRRAPRRTPRRTAAAVLALGLAAGTVAAATPASGYGGAPWFEPNKPYTQNFPDPSVLRVGSDYYAYATGTGGSYLPVMHSRDQQTWIAREAYDPGGGLAQKYPGFNDALPWVASWGQHYDTGMHMTSWVTAPGVEKFGNTYNAYYGLLETKPDKACISVATSSSPKGPFRDNTTRPLVCEGDAPGSIDPQPFIDPATGRKYLLWAGEGVGGNPPTKLWSRELTADGLGFVGSASALTSTTQAWEGRMIENPSMVRYRGQLYLLYSANDWWTDRYAVGYALCDTPLGPCRKPRGVPLLTGNGLRLGPGGATGFLEADGRLKIAYHHWNAPYVGYPTDSNCDGGGKCTSQGQRRMSIAELSDTGAGLEVGGPAPSVDLDPSGRTWVAHRGHDGSVSVRPVAPNGARGTPISLGGRVIGSPAVVAGDNGALAVVVRGVDNRVHVNSRATETAPWTGWGDIGGHATSRPTAASWGNGRLDVFVRGSDGQVWHRPQVSPGQWLGWSPLGGFVRALTAPAATATGDNRLVVSVVGNDRQSWSRTWNGTSWTPWGPMGGNITGDVSLSSPQPGRAVLATRGADDTGWTSTLTTSSGGFSTTGWAPLGGVLSSSPSVTSAPAGGRTDVVTTGLDGGLWRNTQSAPGGRWTGWHRL